MSADRQGAVNEALAALKGVMDGEGTLDAAGARLVFDGIIETEQVSRGMAQSMHGLIAVLPDAVYALVVEGVERWKDDKPPLGPEDVRASLEAAVRQKLDGAVVVSREDYEYAQVLHEALLASEGRAQAIVAMLEAMVSEEEHYRGKAAAVEALADAAGRATRLLQPEAPEIFPSEGLDMPEENGHGVEQLAAQIAERADFDPHVSLVDAERVRDAICNPYGQRGLALEALDRMQARLNQAMPIVAALAIYGDRVDLAALIEKAQALNEAQP
jgi:hypothetical protein